MSEATAEDQLRSHTRAALQAAGISQAEVCRQIGCSTKYLSQMLTGHATLTLTWAEGILGLAGQRLVIGTQPDEPGSST
ncbi:helix-turn-helix domain-containing protein [Streptomyces sp. NPDC060001]|uniref:helix-turn-helix domain-containing protein n=1 Tax=Streptomyces sp. NPDC060001 TaxID=3347032 RepID=UPI0036B45BE6